MGKGVKINSECKVIGNGSVSVGQESWIGLGVEFYVPDGASILIGKQCDLGPRVNFICGTHIVGDSFRRAGMGSVENIYVGSGVWIGAGSKILPGVYLNDGVVVAAGSVVIRGTYPSNSLLAGNPARLKKNYD